MENKKSKKIGKYVVISLIVLGILVCFFVPSVNTTMNSILKMFASGDFTVVRQFVESYGAYAALVSFLLMILQSIAAPLPAFLLTFANANLFGWWKGAILSWSSAMAGAAVCFYIARLLGRDAVEKLTSRTGLKQIDEFFVKHCHHPCDFLQLPGSQRVAMPTVWQYETGCPAPRNGPFRTAKRPMPHSSIALSAFRHRFCHYLARRK